MGRLPLLLRRRGPLPRWSPGAPRSRSTRPRARASLSDLPVRVFEWMRIHFTRAADHGGSGRVLFARGMSSSRSPGRFAVRGLSLGWLDGAANVAAPADARLLELRLVALHRQAGAPGRGAATDTLRATVALGMGACHERCPGPHSRSGVPAAGPFVLLLLEILIAGIVWTLRVEARAGLESLAGARAAAAAEAALASRPRLGRAGRPESLDAVLARCRRRSGCPAGPLGTRNWRASTSTLVEVVAQGFAGGDGVAARRQRCAALPAAARWRTRPAAASAARRRCRNAR